MNRVLLHLMLHLLLLRLRLLQGGLQLLKCLLLCRTVLQKHVKFHTVIHPMVITTTMRFGPKSWGERWEVPNRGGADAEGLDGEGGEEGVRGSCLVPAWVAGKWVRPWLPGRGFAVNRGDG